MFYQVVLQEQGIGFSFDYDILHMVDFSNQSQDFPHLILVEVGIDSSFQVLCFANVDNLVFGVEILVNARFVREKR